MHLLVLPLFANVPAAASDGWSNKEVLIAIGSTIAAMLPIFWGIFEYFGRGQRDRIAKLEADQHSQQDKLHQIPQLQKTLESAYADVKAAQANATALSIQLKDLQLKHQELSAESSTREKHYQETTSALTVNLEKAKEDANRAEQELAGVHNRIRKGLEKDSRTWNEPILRSSSVKFRELTPQGRTTPIISVLNLKGGVGKTTLVANLAAALSSLHHRTLMVDLDLQGSLSNLFLDPAEQKILESINHTLKDLLQAAYDAESPNINDYIRGIEGSNGLSIIPTSDELAYMETDLAMRWRLRDGTKDVRLLLRKQLQLAKVTDRFEFMLLDCPPVISVSCVNALAASDYLLIPVMPSGQVTDRVPILLRRLKEFIKTINPDLRILGIVANRTYGATLTSEEENRMSGLLDQCNEVLGQHVNMFKTNIPQNKEIRSAEDNRRTLERGDGLHEVFLSLAREIVGRLPSYCTATANAEGVMS